MPIYADWCNHGRESFVGSFKVYREDERVDTYDLYIFERNCVCLRYGNKPEEYLSPGKIVNLISASYHARLYHEALILLQAKGDIIFARKEESHVFS